MDVNNGNNKTKNSEKSKIWWPSVGLIELSAWHKHTVDVVCVCFVVFVCVVGLEALVHSNPLCSQASLFTSTLLFYK